MNLAAPIAATASMMTDTSCRWLATAGALGALAVACGAFGAHALPDWLEQLGYAPEDVTRRLEIFATAAEYNLIHSLALAVTALLLDRTPAARFGWAARSFLFGLIVFCGCLYTLTFVGPQLRWLGAIVPIGGVALIAGWVLLAVGAMLGQAK